MTASPHSPTMTRARERRRGGVHFARGALALIALLPMLMLFAPPFAARALADERVKGEVKVSTDGGYARLTFRFEKEMPATIQITYPVMVIAFKKPVNIPVDSLTAAAPGYISAARIDPDGLSLRIALSRKVKFNATPAAELLFVDLLPESWSEAPPGLPREVIEELAKRALDAERQLRMQRYSRKPDAPAAIRVTVATQPTFTRYVFAMPEMANAVPETGTGRLALEFDQSIKWDLADARAAMPPSVQAINSETAEDSTTVTFVLNGNPQVRTFREDRSIVVDIGRDAAKPKVAEGAAPDAAAPTAVPGIAPPETVPAKDAAAPAPAKDAAAPTPPAPPAAAAAPPAAKPIKQADNANGPVVVDLTQSGNTLRAEFPFAAETPAAVFQRADMLWLVFDTAAAIDLSALANDSSHMIRSATLERSRDGAAIVRIKLERPRLVALEPDSPGWIVTIGDSVAAPSRPLAIVRNIVGRTRASIAIPFDHPAKLHVFTDRDVGDRLMVVTALAPARGLLKGQNFVELRALPSTQGVVLQPLADDVSAELAVDKIVVTRPGGLSLSQPVVAALPINDFRALSFDTQLWAYNKQADFNAREAELTQIAAMAPPAERKQARLNLARFYLAWGMAAEAKAVIDVARADAKGDDDVTGSVLESVASLMLARPDDTLKQLSDPRIGNQLDAPIWRAIANADLGKWAEAQAAFKDVDNAMSALPVELQRMALRKALRTAIEVRDLSGADRILNELTTLGVPPQMKPELDVLVGRLREALGRNAEALVSYRAAAVSADRRAAAQGRLREILLRYSLGDMANDEAIGALETLTTIWRGDETEAEGLKLLAHLYTEQNRYRAAFHVMRTALLVHPYSDYTRQIQDEARATFDSLFLGGKGDSLSPIEALGLFYDYRDLTPIGWRGDEMIRKLADRLVAVDLLDQAAELLQHQVDHRLQGGARAQVATRLAVIYLMNRKPERAIATLQATRTAELSGELRDQRLLLEARALSETGRHDLALELIANIDSHEAMRLRSDILWSAKRWRAAAEQIESLYGERWRDFTPLDDTERFDILRAAIGYSLGDEPLGLARFRERYAPKLAGTPDARAFDVVSAPVGAGGSEFEDIARKVTGVDSLEAFLRDMRTRYPDSSAISRAPAAPAAAAPAAAAAPPAKTQPAPPVKPDRTPTGSISRLLQRQ